MNLITPFRTAPEYRGFPENTQKAATSDENAIATAAKLIPGGGSSSGATDNLRYTYVST
ncbi:hypothetical protein ACWEFL_18605 [Streptomyces sp. NPDC004838]